MGDLEQFISSINQILQSAPAETRYERLAAYLFADGWPTLCSLYSQRLSINVAFGEKLVDLLVDNCVKLVASNLATCPLSIPKDCDNIKVALADLSSQLDRNLRVGSELFRTIVPLDGRWAQIGSLFHFLIVCLELYLRYNDGTSKSPLQSANSSLLVDLTEAILISL